MMKFMKDKAEAAALKKVKAVEAKKGIDPPAKQASKKRNKK